MRSRWTIQGESDEEIWYVLGLTLDQEGQEYEGQINFSCLIKSIFFFTIKALEFRHVSTI
jgi:hypothetical protein